MSSGTYRVRPFDEPTFDDVERLRTTPESKALRAALDEVEYFLGVHDHYSALVVCEETLRRLL